MLICPYLSFFLQPTLPSSSHQHSTDPALTAFTLSDPVVPPLSSSRSLALAQLTTPSFSCSLFSWTSQHDILLGFCILFWLPSLSVCLSLPLSFFFFTPLLLDHFQILRCLGVTFSPQMISCGLMILNTVFVPVTPKCMYLALPFPLSFRIR